MRVTRATEVMTLIWLCDRTDLLVTWRGYKPFGFTLGSFPTLIMFLNALIGMSIFQFLSIEFQ